MGQDNKVILFDNEADLIKAFTENKLEGANNNESATKSKSGSNKKGPKSIEVNSTNTVNDGMGKSGSTTEKRVPTSISLEANNGMKKSKSTQNKHVPTPISLEANNGMKKSKSTQNKHVPTPISLDDKGKKKDNSQITKSNNGGPKANTIGSNEGKPYADDKKNGVFKPITTTQPQLPAVSGNMVDVPINGLGSSFGGTSFSGVSNSTYSRGNSNGMSGGARVANFFSSLFDVLILRGVLFYILAFAVIISVCVYIYLHRVQIISSIISWFVFIIIGWVIWRYIRRRFL